MTKTFKEVIDGIRKAVFGIEVREDIAQGMEYVEQFAETSTTKAQEAADSAAAAQKAQSDTAAAKTEAVKAISTAKQSGLDAISTAQSGALTDISSARTAALSDVAASTKTATDAASTAKAKAEAASASASAAKTSETNSGTNATNAKGSEIKTAEYLQATKEYFEQVRTITIGAQGWYATPEALKAAVPIGENGWWAVVGTTDTIWTWDSDTKAWVNTQTKTDLSDFYTRSQSDERFAPQKHTHPTSDIKADSTTYYAGNSGPIEAAQINDLRANRLAFLPGSAVTVEYSVDGGSTWADYGATDAQKAALFTMRKAGSFCCGKHTDRADTTAKDQLRITIEPVDRYCSVNMLYLWVTVSGTTATVDIERSTIGEKTTFSNVRRDVPIVGWSGPNEIRFSFGTFGGNESQIYQAYAYRFIFKNLQDAKGAVSVHDIRMYGPSAWGISNNMMSADCLYSWDDNQNAKFPAAVTATEFKGKLDWSNVQNKPSAYTLPPATADTLGGVMVGENITNTDGTISLTGENVVAALTYTPATKDAATQTTPGLMSAADKKKMDELDSAGSIAASGDNYVRFADGTQICWNPGETVWTAEDNGWSFSFPVPFVDANYSAAFLLTESPYSGDKGLQYALQSKCTATKLVMNLVNSKNHAGSAIVIGRWK